MAELLILFLVLICILLIVTGITYKCTDGTTNTEDFSFDKCFKFGENKTPEDDKSQDEKLTATKSPLLSDGNNSMGSLFGSKLVSNDDDEVDYSSYVDYYTRDKRPVYDRSTQPTLYNPYDDPSIDAAEKNRKTVIDSLDINVYHGIGECAKLCYEGDYELGEDEEGDEEKDLENSCNAFKMKNDKTCTLYWSVSDDPGKPDETEYVYRLKKPKSPDSHQTMLEDSKKNGEYAVFFDEVDYHQSIIPGPSIIGYDPNTKNEHQYTYTLGRHKFPMTRQAGSAIVPEDFCGRGWSGRNWDGNEVDLGMFNRNLKKDGNNIFIQSFKLGTPGDDGDCDYPDADDKTAVGYGAQSGSGEESCKYIEPNNAGSYEDPSGRDGECTVSHLTPECTRRSSLNCMVDEGEDCCEWK